MVPQIFFPKSHDKKCERSERRVRGLFNRSCCVVLCAPHKKNGRKKMNREELNAIHVLSVSTSSPWVTQDLLDAANGSDLVKRHNLKKLELTE